MMPNNQPSEGNLVAPATTGKQCRACHRWFSYSPLYRWPAYCGVCVRSSTGKAIGLPVSRDAASATCLEDVQPGPERIAGEPSVSSNNPGPLAPRKS